MYIGFVVFRNGPFQQIMRFSVVSKPEDWERPLRRYAILRKKALLH